VGPSRTQQLADDVDFLITSAAQALGQSDYAHAATLIEDFTSVLVSSAAEFNTLPTEIRVLPRKRNDRLAISEWAASALVALASGADAGISESVDHGLRAVWRQAWGLAVAGGDVLGATYLAQVAATFERLIHSLTPSDRQQRFREGVAAGTWRALGWYDVSAEGKGPREMAADRFAWLGAAAVTAMLNQLRQTIRHADPGAFDQVLQGNLAGELEVRGDLRRNVRVARNQAPRDDGEDLELVSADLHDRFMIGVGKAVSWSFQSVRAGRVPLPAARSISVKSENLLTPDVGHVVRLLRNDRGELLLPGEHDTDWMWEVPTGVFTISSSLGQPLWAFVLTYLRTPPAGPILLPELQGTVIESDPEHVFADVLKEAETDADQVAAFLDDGLTAATVRTRVADLRRETVRWKQQLRTMRLTRIATQPLNQSLIEEQGKAIQAAFDRHRVLGRLLKEAARETSLLASRVSPYTNERQLYPREDFVVGAEGAARFAEHLGETMAHSESSVIGLAAIEARKDVRRVDWRGFDGAVREATAELRDAGYAPSVVMIGDQASRTAIVMQPRLRSDPEDRYVLGTKDGALVVVAAHLPAGIAIVADLVRAGHSVLHLQTEGAHPVRSTIEDLSEQQMGHLLQMHEHLHKDEDGRALTEAEARLRLRSQVRWSVHLHTNFEVDDQGAIRLIQMDPVPSDDQVVDYLTEEGR